MEVSLVMVQADGKQKEVSLGRLPAVIGRDEGVRVRVPLGSVSRRHCEILEEDDELVVRDLKSSNGTYVNGDRISGPRELIPGDLLAVGPVVFVVRIDGHPKEVDAADSYAAGAVEPGGAPSGGGGSVGGGGAVAKPAPQAAAKPPPPAAAAPSTPAKPAKKDDDDDEDVDFSDLLEGLDLDDEDDEPSPKKK